VQNQHASCDVGREASKKLGMTKGNEENRSCTPHSRCSTVEKRNKFRKLETEKVGGRHRGALEFNIKSTPSVGACFVD
jgi:hypothetical protein